MSRLKPECAVISSSRTSPALCPYCARTLDAVTGAGFNGDDAPIQPGDTSVCGYCGEVLRWDGRIYRKATPEETAAMYKHHGWLIDFIRDRVSRKATEPVKTEPVN